MGYTENFLKKLWLIRDARGALVGLNIDARGSCVHACNSRLGYFKEFVALLRNGMMELQRSCGFVENDGSGA